MDWNPGEKGWLTARATADEFLLGMMSLGEVLEVSLVAAFDPEGYHPGRASRRAVDLPFHKDGIRSEALADLQGGLYVERSGVDYVGLYCLKGGSNCFTTLSSDGAAEEAAVELAAGQALVLDNAALWHGRRGPVGDRVVLRAWVRRTASTKP